MEELSNEQQRVLDHVLAWLERNDAPPIFILTGSAGTGKTLLIRHLVRALQDRRIHYALAAPTGRAARILSERTGDHARTLHSLIYIFDRYQLVEEADRQTDEPLSLQLHFALRSAEHDARLIIVDEASMVSDTAGEEELYRFGSGRLLNDLLTFARLIPKRDRPPTTRLLFVGDPAQLPPVGQSVSPALSAQYLRDTFGLSAETAHLRSVYRQRKGHPILEAATALRNALEKGHYHTFRLPEQPPDLRPVGLEEAIETTATDFRRQNPSVLLCRTNALARKLNAAVRARLWGREGLPPQPGDLLLVNRNAPLHGLFNGDLVLVETVGPLEHRRVGRRGRPPVDLYFRDVELLYPHEKPRNRIRCKLLENLLESPDGQLSPDLIQALLIDFYRRHPSLKHGSSEFRLMLANDAYFNALHVRYGYAMTVHKAQGGEWKRATVVFNDWRHFRHAEFFRWAYTAITRAREELLTIGAPSFEALSDMRWQPAPSVPAPEQAAENATRFPLKALETYHQRLSEALTAAGIETTGVELLQYAVRYHLARADRTTRIQYYYRGDGQISRIVTLGGADDPELTQQAYALFERILSEPPADSGELPENPLLREFLERAHLRLEGSGIRIVHWKEMPYALRLYFSADGENVTIDFYYNRRGVWTHAQEVGRSSSGALFARIQSLLQADS